MAALQTQFDQFHASIKLGENDEKANLRTKRDTLIKALAARLPEDVPEFDTFHQGSYSMHTGVRPLDGNYDIDIGVVFDCTRDAYPDPVQLKKKIRDALDTHGRTVNIRRPCVTVNYVRDGEVDYHVDLAIYTKRADGLLDLAKGKEHSAAEHRVWEASDPEYLTELICTRFEGAEVKQYRRCIRYMKRWRQVRFSSGGPLSIALTAAAYHWFKPYQTTSGTMLDIVALLDWVNKILQQFSYQLTDEGFYPRLAVELPSTPYSDLMQSMTRIQMDNFRAELESLRDALQAAYEETLPEEAAKKLVKVFGDDFPIPSKASTAKAVTASFIGTGNSA
jgi:hypothetical protein